MTPDQVELRRGFKEYAVRYMQLKNSIFEILDRHYRDKCLQGLMNNLWSNNPGELERWADDGGKEP